MGKQSRLRAEARAARVALAERHAAQRSVMTEAELAQEAERRKLFEARRRADLRGRHQTVTYDPWVAVGGRKTTDH